MHNEYKTQVRPPSLYTIQLQCSLSSKHTSPCEIWHNIHPPHLIVSQLSPKGHAVDSTVFTVPTVSCPLEDCGGLVTISYCGSSTYKYQIISALYCAHMWDFKNCCSELLAWVSLKKFLNMELEKQLSQLQKHEDLSLDPQCSCQIWTWEWSSVTRTLRSRDRQTPGRVTVMKTMSPKTEAIPISKKDGITKENTQH